MAMSESKDFYETLGVSTSASDNEIRDAFRKLARAHHPDRFDASRRASAEMRFQAITEAYNVLGDKERRERYDRARQKNTPTEVPRDPRELARLLLANAAAAARQGDAARARELFDQAVAHDTESARAHHLFGIFLCRQGGDARLGLRHLDTAARLAPMDVRILVDASRGFVEAGMAERAKRYAKQARDLAPGDPGVEEWWQELQSGKGRS